jgi:O-antigen/teichoic acid export membrane protein
VQLKFGFSKETFLLMLGFSGWNIFGSIAHLVKSHGINILLNLFFSPAINAARTLAYQVLTALNAFTNNIMIASRPQIIKSYAQNNIEYLTGLVFNVSKFSFFLLLFLSLPVLVEINQILHFWIGSNVPEYTTIFTRLIILTALVEVFASPLSTVVHATGKMKKFQTVCSSIILLIIPISYCFLKLGFPPESPMAVSLIICILVHAVRVYLIKQLVPFSVLNYFSEVIAPAMKVCVLALILPLLLYFNMKSHIYRFICTFMTCALSTGVIIYFVGLKKEERAKFNAKAISIHKKFLKVK